MLNVDSRLEKGTHESIFHEITRSLCPECGQVIDAQVLLRDDKVIMRKRCPIHGWFEALVSTDAEGYVTSTKYNKPGTIPLEYATQVRQGCPYDCGLCPEHKQHTCSALIEVTTACDMACHTCFANAGPGYTLTLEQVEFMVDCFLSAEGNPEVLQLSGGEPSLHPQLFDMIRLAHEKGIRHVVINTNGRRIARDPEWARRLGELRPKIYLAFDGLNDETYVKLRGEPLLQEKLTALQRLDDMELDTILVTAVERGINEHEIGEIVRFGLEHPTVRGVAFQPVTHTGRCLPFDPMDRVTSTEVLQRLEEQTDGLFRVKDFIPLPCPHPACIQMTYAYVEDDQVTPLPRLLNVGDYLDYITNRAWGELSEDVRQALETMWSAQSVPGTESLASSFSCASCNIQLPESLSELANRIFYVGSHAFMDAHTFDLKRARSAASIS